MPGMREPMGRHVGTSVVSRLAQTRLKRIASSRSGPCFTEASLFVLLAHQLQLLIDRWELDNLRRLEKQSMTLEVASQMHVQADRSKSLVA
jgi:hypothetical protein